MASINEAFAAALKVEDFPESIISSMNSVMCKVLRSCLAEPRLVASLTVLLFPYLNTPSRLSNEMLLFDLTGKVILGGLPLILSLIHI